ncbi:ester cyclase [Actinoplanes oblitus]|uniref:Ester cyclase n=1 Tax=Actinoplanes oblitus TaxID=3040509 RepID=A0ABY8WRP8_9ACTN|nr:ester cyclase [Actinoplanes oblitus]WIM99477.1 ester cyclase [Actinoplanes oblitus]
MSIEAFTQLFDEVFSKGDLDAADRLVADEIIDHQFAPDGSPGRVVTREQFKQFVRMLRAGLPDLRYTVEDATREGDKVWMRVRARGTDSGTGQFGHPPTGRPVSIDVIDVARFVDGRMVEHWGVPDRLSVLQQVGHHA